jgi:hypothetical protein
MTTTIPSSKVDLHAHVGAERTEGSTVDDYVSHLTAHGVTLAVLTDHFEFYAGNPNGARTRTYANNLAGYEAFAADFTKATTDRGTWLFGPEVIISDLESPLLRDMLAMNAVTYFIAEPSNWHPDETHHEHLVRGIRLAAKLREQTGVPCHVAHPFWKAMIDFLGQPVGFPERPPHPPLPPLSTETDADTATNALFDVDIVNFAAISREHGVPIEVNGSMWRKVHDIGDPGLTERWIHAFRGLSEITSLVPGSDLHRLNQYNPPLIPFAEIGVENVSVAHIRNMP